MNYEMFVKITPLNNHRLSKEEQAALRETWDAHPQVVDVIYLNEYGATLRVLFDVDVKASSTVRAIKRATNTQWVKGAVIEAEEGEETDLQAYAGVVKRIY
jgi:hypothetical protein